jgi:DNA-binding NarL/FixJ family response regulator
MSTGRIEASEWTNPVPISGRERVPGDSERSEFQRPRASEVATRLTALVADRQPVVREGLRSWLRAGDFEIVAEVDDAAEAVIEAERLRPEVAILGASASELAVAAACAAIADRAPGTATVVLADAVDDDAVLEVALAGARAFLLKEAVGADLPDVLRRVAAGEQVVDASAAGALFRARQHSMRRTLTDQELKIVRLAAEGCTNREIGRRLYLSRHTVKEYLSNAMRKLEVGSRVEAAVEAGRLGLLEAPLQRKAS